MKLGMTAVGLLLAGAFAASAEERVMKFSFYGPAVHPAMASIEAWGKSIGEASGGTIRVEIYPAEQLGKTVDQYDIVRDGIAEVAKVPPGMTPGRFPIVTLSEIPFLMSDTKAGSAAFHRFYEKYADREMGDVKVCLTLMHDPGALHTSGKQVKSPQDLAGMKIRPANGTIANLVSSQGATTVQAAMPEIRELAERGVTDGVTFPWRSVFLTKAEGSLTYHLDLDLYTAPNIIAINKDFYESLNDAQKAAIDSHCTPEWSTKMISDWADFDAQGKEMFAAMPGHVIYTPTAEETAAWVAAAEPQAQRIAEGISRLGLDGNQLLEELRAELAK